MPFSDHSDNEARPRFPGNARLQAMWRRGSSGQGLQRPRVVAWLVLVAPALVWSCGGASKQSQGTPSGGAGSSAQAGSSTGGNAGASTGGKVAGGGSSAGMNRGGAEAGGGQPIGDAGAGGNSAAAGGAGTGGAPDPLLGIECGDQVCSVGQACILCQVEGMSERLCVPHPEGDPTGYAAAIEPCDPAPSSVFDDCDGPEDCGANQFCVAREGPDGFTRCRDMPSTQHSCCFACGAPTNCTICRSAEDCPDGETCSPAQAASGVMGCH
jgi:hypothetical protein